MKSIALPSVLSALIGASCLLMANADPAAAQALGTWVAGVGDDVNPCSRTAPCKTFAGAISKTAAGGEIRCLDPGGFGNVTITKSLTIDCFGTLGAILVPGGSSGIIINAADIVVILRHIDINGANTGVSGIRFLQGAALIVEHTRISRFKAGIGAGIHVNTGSDSRVYVTDTVISDSGNGNSGGGIVIQPTGAGQAFVALSRVTLSHNANGIFAQGLGTSGPIVTEVRDSSAAGSFFHGILAITDASTAGILIDRSTLALSGGNGILAQGTGALVHLSSSTVRGNSVGLGVSGGGQIISFQNNQIAGNGTDGAPTSVLTVK